MNIEDKGLKRIDFFIDDDLTLTSYGDNEMGTKFIMDQITDPQYNKRWSNVTIGVNYLTHITEIRCTTKSIYRVLKWDEQPYYFRTPKNVMSDFESEYECKFYGPTQPRDNVKDYLNQTKYFGESELKQFQTREAFRLEELNHQVNHKGSNNYCGFCRAEHIMKELEEKQRIKTPWSLDGKPYNGSKYVSPRIDRKETYSRRVSGGTLYEFSKSYHILEHKNRNIYHVECDFCELDTIESKKNTIDLNSWW